jgi:hypothetical protein
MSRGHFVPIDPWKFWFHDGFGLFGQLPNASYPR